MKLPPDMRLLAAPLVRNCTKLASQQEMLKSESNNLHSSVARKNGRQSHTLSIVLLCRDVVRLATLETSA